MSSFNLNGLLNQLEISGSEVKPTGVSFRGRGLKLDSKEDCVEVISAINAAPDMTFLDLEGNTLGVDAAEAIGVALKNKKKISRALWKDMFTGRMKTEIPLALEFMTAGLRTAGAMLTELDLSDNAFGPIGVKALADFLQSPVCFGLQELRLNNNGLGVNGAKILATALTKSLENSSAAGKPLALKIFQAGRNRLENQGTTALSGVFKALGSLQEISMPQNGIYYVGINQLSNALTANKNLRLLNLNDNTVTHKGAKSLANALPALQKLQILNLGDCLLRTKGAVILAQALLENHNALEELILDSNEIRVEGGLAVIHAMRNKKNSRVLSLLGNEFGENGRTILKKEAEKLNLDEALVCPSDDDADPSEDDEGTGSEDEDSPDENSTNELSDEEVNKVPPVVVVKPTQVTLTSDGDINGFLAEPTLFTFSKLLEKDISEVAKILQTEKDIPTFIQLIMKVSNMGENETMRKESKILALKLYSVLFNWCGAQQLSVVNNELFVHLKLIKGEDRDFQTYWNTKYCVSVLQDAIAENIIPEFTQNILTCCLDRKK